ncbi:OmpA family protein [Paraburkholderia edwinii]|jgi:OOP family OmpA-OmpF porin|uniref:OmpA family protein n=1 Tax=Paraburkholderia edwinii TaxID=2861782 RepID=A0ABX8UUR7_9BURK|nr:OmpA family protein [Paraburkholderia edwinii]QYD72391.1 OmpA family protein [Paraburkholderia edwinii]
MKYSLITLACAALLAGCSASATRDQLQVQNPTVLQTGFGATQDAAAGAATAQWLDTYRGADNRKMADSVQQRLQALGARKDNYFGAKAQCWADAAQQERSQFNHWGFVEEALREADRLTTSLETGNNLSAENPELRTATVVRPDVWQQILAAKSAPEFPTCIEAQRLTACSEVEMIHAGHEAWTRDFSDSAKRVDQVTQTLPAIGTALNACKPPPPPPPPPRIAPKVTLGGDTTFRFDRGDVAGMLPDGRARLDRLIDDLKQVDDVRGIGIDGYTDRIGSDTYNRQLSKKRADTVRNYLQKGGVSVPMTSRGHGKADPVVQCDERNREQLIECLAPNRRVEMNFTRSGPAAGVQQPGE